jgi:hypothetical protein
VKHARLSPLLIFVLLAQARAATEANNELNRQRAKAGLWPYTADRGLIEGAEKCANYRAAHHIQFHIGDDFGFLPPGCKHYTSPGRGGWMDQLEQGGAGVSNDVFEACFADWPKRLPGEMAHGDIPGVRDNTVYAGAAVAFDERGRRYCQLFVSSVPSSFFRRPIESVVRATRAIFNAREVSDTDVRATRIIFGGARETPEAAEPQATVAVDNAPNYSYPSSNSVTPEPGQSRPGLLGRLRSRLHRSSKG